MPSLVTVPLTLEICSSPDTGAAAPETLRIRRSLSAVPHLESHVQRRFALGLTSQHNVESPAVDARTETADRPGQGCLPGRLWAWVLVAE